MLCFRLGALSLGEVACSVPQGESPHPGSCDPFQLTVSKPAHDAVGVPPDIIPVLTFNDFPDPDSIDPASTGVSTILLYTGFYYYTGRYWVDLVERRALFQPSGELTLGLGYTLVLRPGIKSLRGCFLEPPPPDPDGTRADTYAIRFQIADSRSTANPRPVPPAPPRYGEVVSVFARRCAGGSCHLAAEVDPHDARACLADAAGSLSLCARDARADLVGVTSRQVSRLVRVAPPDSSRSYLLRKLIGAPPIVGHVGIPRRASGRDDAGTEARSDLSREELLIIQAWIDTGAPGS